MHLIHFFEEHVELQCPPVHVPGAVSLFTVVRLRVVTADEVFLEVFSKTLVTYEMAFNDCLSSAVSLIDVSI